MIDPADPAPTTIVSYFNVLLLYDKFEMAVDVNNQWFRREVTYLLQGCGRQNVSGYHVFQQLLVTSIHREVRYSYQP